MMKALSPTMEEGGIQKWKVKVGDKVKVGQVLCDVETDKATMEYESDYDGTILAIIKTEGSSSKVGEPIAVVGEPGEDYSALMVETKGKVQEQTPAGAGTVQGQSPVRAGTVQGQSPVQPGTVPGSTPPPAPSSGRVKASPLAKRIASEKGLDINQIPGTGPEGRVIRSDVESWKGAAVAAASAPRSPSVFPSALNDERIPVSRKRGVIAKRLAESLFTAPHFFLTLSVEMDGLMEARERINEKRKEKVGLNPFIIKFVAEALKRHQGVNSSWEGDFIQNHSSVDIGMAVAQPDGLITPVIRDCGSKGILQIDSELKDLIDRGRAGTLKPEEYTGATFTISNLGAFGIEEFTAIINPPGAAILALGTTAKTPVVNDNDQVVIRKVMKATLSCDHRVVDGAVGAGFLKEWKDMMEDPYRVLM